MSTTQTEWAWAVLCLISWLKLMILALARLEVVHIGLLGLGWEWNSMFRKTIFQAALLMVQLKEVMFNKGFR